VLEVDVLKEKSPIYLCLAHLLDRYTAINTYLDEHVYPIVLVYSQPSILTQVSVHAFLVCKLDLVSYVVCMVLPIMLQYL
jgi:hypothetical protein